MAWRLNLTYDQKQGYNLDPEKPHLIGFVHSEFPIRKDKIAVSEFSVILWLAMKRGGERYRHHQRIPVSSMKQP